MPVKPIAACLLLALSLAACRATDRPPPAAGDATRPHDVVVVTIDTLRADRLGTYGWQAARTPTLDALARRGVQFTQAFATAPITLPSHASLFTGLYPPGHGARHNGMRVRPDVPTLAEALRARGFATGAFVAAFPLDRRFGLDRGFETYSDALPRGADGHVVNERPGRDVVADARAWLAAVGDRRVFLWMHLFEPHAPYEAADEYAGTAARSMSDRYDDEIARADRSVGELLAALGPRLARTLVVVASDHGEAFGEHGEVGHSVFVYDTTLRVPLILAGPGIDRPAGAQHDVSTSTVSLVDVLPTVLELLEVPRLDTDGTSLVPALQGRDLPGRTLYAESFAPLLDFGWSPLRTVRTRSEKFIAAPTPELYDLASDPGETRNLATARAAAARELAERADRISPAGLSVVRTAADPDAQARLQSLGYLGTARPAGADRPDPKDRVELAARMAEITSGELRGHALREALVRVLAEDPGNGQMAMRLGFVLLESGECAAAIPHFTTAVSARVPSADPYLGLAECYNLAGRPADAQRALAEADRTEPGNPVVGANLGMLALAEGRLPDAIDRLRAALAAAPDLHQARFALARAYARDGRRDDALRETRDLLQRLPADAPQRSEVERLLAALQ